MTSLIQASVIIAPSGRLRTYSKYLLVFIPCLCSLFSLTRRIFLGPNALAMGHLSQRSVEVSTLWGRYSVRSTDLVRQLFHGRVNFMRLGRRGASARSTASS